MSLLQVLGILGVFAAVQTLGPRKLLKGQVHIRVDRSEKKAETDRLLFTFIELGTYDVTFSIDKTERAESYATLPKNFSITVTERGENYVVEEPFLPHIIIVRVSRRGSFRTSTDSAVI